jgi:hypothetical protein
VYSSKNFDTVLIVLNCCHYTLKGEIDSRIGGIETRKIFKHNIVNLTGLFGRWTYDMLILIPSDWLSIAWFNL